TCRSSGGRSTPISSSTRGTARSAGRLRAARAGRSRISSAAADPSPTSTSSGRKLERKGRPPRSPLALPGRPPLFRAAGGALSRRDQPGLGNGFNGEFAHEIRQREQSLVRGAVVVLQVAERAVAYAKVDLRGAHGGDVCRIRACAHRPQAAVERDEH